MADWKIKRFWKAAEAVAAGDGWTITLDGRPVRTPAKAPLIVPSRALAQRLVLEWDAQEGEIDPLSMPMTRSANAAIDKVVPQFAEVSELIAAYGETDLCCYRAEAPEALVAQQAEAWDPLLDWAASAFAAPLRVTVGIAPVPQPEASLVALRQRVAAEDAFALTALHDLVALSGSLVLGLAAIEGVLDPDELWRRSRIDEIWQENQWGADEMAVTSASIKHAAFLHALEFYRLSRPHA
ncbi:ATP12 family chaperone protein [Tropicimonas sp. IMCC34043]|uniref:ATP12 family chaperone protein n=1 Tax=Tropicimonas sp. IMCC34043 TaxID=2248760 RepID=UPI000E28339E|nr:ATP12 family protein [Tropicimonas sp. IMCC34043]